MSRQTRRVLASLATALALTAGAVAFVAPALADPLASPLPDGKFTLECSVVDGRVTQCTPPAEPTPSPTPTATTPVPTTTEPQVTPSPTAPPVTTTPAPTTPPATTPPPTTTSPPASGWPNASTTGATGPLTVRTGNLTISTAGAVVEGLDIRGCVNITAPGVVFRNSKVSCSNGWAIRAVSTGGVVIDQVDVTCNNTLGKGIVGEGFTVRRSDVSGCEDAIYIDRNVNVLDSYLHDLYGGGTDPHNDIVQVSNGGDNVIVRGNFMSNRTSRATSGYMGDGPGMDNIVIDRNYIEAGGYVIYCSSSGVNNVVSNNTIDALGYGPWYSTCSRSGIVRTGNTLI